MKDNSVNIKITIGANSYDVKVLKKEVNELGKSLSNTDSIANELKNNFGKIALSIGGITAISTALKDTVTTGIEANKTFENLKIQLTGLIAANSTNISSLGRVLNVQEKWNLGIKESDSILKELNKTNANTKFSLDEIAGAFNMFYATSINQDNRAKAVLAMDSIALAAQAVGKNLRDLTPMMDSLATGTVIAASEMGSFMKIVGLTNEELKKANENGKLYDYLISKLLNFKDLSQEAAKSYEVALGGLKNEYEDLAKELSKPIFLYLTQSFLELGTYIKENKELIIDYVQKVVEVSKYLGLLATAFVSVKIAGVGLKAVTTAYNTILPIFGSNINRTIVLTTLLQRGLTAVKLAFKSFLPTAGIFAAFEAMTYFSNSINKVQNATDRLNKSLSLTNDELKKMSQNQRDLAIIELEKASKDLYEEYANLERSRRLGNGIAVKRLQGDELIEVNAKLDTIKQKRKEIQEQIQRYKESIEGDKTQIKIETLVTENKTTKSSLNSESKTKKDELKNILREQNSIYKDYYESIGEYQKAWTIKEEELRQRLNDAKINQTDSDSIIQINKNDYFTKLEDEKKQKTIELLNNQLELENRKFDLKSRALELIDDETIKAQALINLEKEKSISSYNAMLQRGEITQDYYNQALKLEEKLFNKQMFDTSTVGQVVKSGLKSLEGAMSSFFDYSSDKFMKFGDLASSVLNDIANSLMKMLVIQPLVNAIGSGIQGYFGGVTANAKGGIYKSPDLKNYVNTVVDRPTFFKFAKGGVPSLGVMGEKNGGSPEAIMPLYRTKNGDLGVKTDFNTGLTNMKIEVINQTTQEVKVTNVSQRQNLEEQVISIVIDAMHRNKHGLRDIIGANR